MFLLRKNCYALEDITVEFWNYSDLAVRGRDCRKKKAVA
jgi:hypothetical protein